MPNNAQAIEYFTVKKIFRAFRRNLLKLNHKQLSVSFDYSKRIQYFLVCWIYTCLYNSESDATKEMKNL